jgi:hypothetical protein
VNQVLVGAAAGVVIVLAPIVAANMLDKSPLLQSIADRVSLAMPGYEPVPWGHGYRTSRVVATRYRNELMGEFIGFRFPDDLYNADRLEVFDFLTDNDGWVFSGGGSPGAENFVKFRCVTDADTANQTMKAILPPLSQLMADLAAGKQVKIEKPQGEPKPCPVPT